MQRDYPLGTRRSTGIYAALIAGTFLSAAPVLIRMPYAVEDEVKCSVPTIRFLAEQRRPPLFVYSSAYMAPVQEVVGSIPFLSSGGQINALRAVGVLFIGIGAIFWFKLLAKIYELRVALAVAACYVVCTPPIAVPRLIMPGYPLGCLTIPMFLYFAYTRRTSNPFLLGLFGGLVHYCFPLSFPFVLFVGAVVTLHAVLLRQPGEFQNAKLWSWPMGLLTAGFAVALPPAYLHFNNVKGQSRLLWPLVTLAATLTLSGLASLWFRHRHRRALQNALATAAIYASGFLLIYVSAALFFKYHERPYFAAHGVRLWSANQYTLKDFREWPFQAIAMFGRIFPLSVVPAPMVSPIRLYADRVLYLSVSGAAVFCLMLVCFRRWILRCIPRTDTILQIVWYCLLPFACLLLLALLTPSWRLFGDPSVRYLIPVLPAFYIIFFDTISSYRPNAVVYWVIVGTAVSLNAISLAVSNVRLFPR